MFTTLSAQVSIGNRAGLSIFHSSYSGAEALVQEFEKYTQSTKGLSVAMPLEIMLTDHFAIQPEIGFTQKGKETVTWMQGAIVTTLNYLDLALLAKARLGPGKLQAEVFLGPGLSYGLTIRQRSVNLLYYNPYSSDYAADFDDTLLAPIEIFLTGGVGISYKIGVPRLFLNYRYVHGTSSLYGDNGIFTDINGAIIGKMSEFNRGSIVSLGFLVPLSRKAWAPAE